MNGVNERLTAIIGEFADLDGREKLELLLDFAAGLPPLSPEYQARKGSEDRRVHECQTPVFLWPEVTDGTARLIAEVAPEAPTVKGFVAILERMGLADVLGILRSRGLRAILSRVKRELAGMSPA